MAYKSKSAYAQSLLDPRWQKRRLQILERDNFACLLCEDNEKTLHVHHTFYKDDADGPWDYPDEALRTLCADCHKDEGPEMKAQVTRLMQAILTAGFWRSELIADLAYSFENVRPGEELKSLETLLLTATIGELLRSRRVKLAMHRGEDMSEENVDPKKWDSLMKYHGYWKD